MREAVRSIGTESQSEDGGAVSRILLDRRGLEAHRRGPLHSPHKQLTTSLQSIFRYTISIRINTYRRGGWQEGERRGTEGEGGVVRVDGECEPLAVGADCEGADMDVRVIVCVL